MAALRVTEFTDPACPFAFSAEPARMRLRWLYGDQIEWRPRMIVLSESPDEYVERGFTPEAQSVALETIRDEYGMPIDTRMRPRMMATVDAMPRAVSEIPAYAGAASADDTPGTISNGTSARLSAIASSAPRPKSSGSPPFNRTTHRPARASEISSCSIAV